MAKIEANWDKDRCGNSILEIKKSKGKLTIREIEEHLMRTNGLQGNYAILIRATESISEGSGWGDEIEYKGDYVELLELSEGESCPICGNKIINT